MLTHAGDNWQCSLLAGARLQRLFGGSIFRAGWPSCPLTHVSINTTIPGVGRRRCLPGGGKGALGSKDEKRRGGEQRGGSPKEKELKSGRAHSRGEVRGPRHESPL